MAKRGRPSKEELLSREPEEVWIRVKRVKVPNSHFPAIQAQKAYVVGDTIVKREDVDQPDMPEVVLAKIQEFLDPETILKAI